MYNFLVPTNAYADIVYRQVMCMAYSTLCTVCVYSDNKLEQRCKKRRGVNVNKNCKEQSINNVELQRKRQTHRAIAVEHAAESSS